MIQNVILWSWWAVNEIQGSTWSPIKVVWNFNCKGCIRCACSRSTILHKPEIFIVFCSKVIHLTLIVKNARNTDFFASFWSFYNAMSISFWSFWIERNCLYCNKVIFYHVKPVLSILHHRLNILVTNYNDITYSYKLNISWVCLAELETRLFWYWYHIKLSFLSSY